MGGLELALTVEQHVEGEDGETETVTKLLDEEASADHHDVAIERITEVDIHHIRQGDGADQRPQPFLHTITTHQDAANDAA